MKIKIKGTAYWAKVFEPDTKFNPDGVYSINVAMPEAEAASVCEQLDDLINDYASKVVKEQPKLKSVLSTRDPYEKEYDDAGNETGNVIFKPKMKASGTTKDGQRWNRKPIVVDAKLTPLTRDTLIGNKSTVKVSFEPAPYYMPSNKQVGVSLRMEGVQVIDLVPYEGSGSSLFDEEEGFVASAVEKDDNSDTFNTIDFADDEGDF